MCCGVDGFRDWGVSTTTFPDSCNCALGSAEGCIRVPVGNNLYSQGCYTKLLPHTVEMVDALGGLAFSVAATEVDRRFFFYLRPNMKIYFSAHRWSGGALSRRGVQEQTQGQCLIVNEYVLNIALYDEHLSG